MKKTSSMLYPTEILSTSTVKQLVVKQGIFLKREYEIASFNETASY